MSRVLYIPPYHKDKQCQPSVCDRRVPWGSFVSQLSTGPPRRGRKGGGVQSEGRGGVGESVCGKRAGGGGESGWIGAEGGVECGKGGGQSVWGGAECGKGECRVWGEAECVKGGGAECVKGGGRVGGGAVWEGGWAV